MNKKSKTRLFVILLFMLSGYAAGVVFYGFGFTMITIGCLSGLLLIITGLNE